MKLLTLLISVLFFLAGCSSARINTEFKFGNKLAKHGLWKEAYYRYTRALKSGPDKASIHNNIAISLEYQNKLREAEAEYKKALELDPDNEYIKRNLSRLKKRMNPGENGEEAGEEAGMDQPLEKGKGRKK